MPKPRHGTLQCNSDDCWIFFPGKQTDTNGILMNDLEANCQELLETGQLFCGHAKFKNVYDTRNQLSLQQCVLHHVSAHGLSSLLCVTITNVWFISFLNSKNNWCNCCALLESRFPEGSSARIIAGLFINALAIATRCCSPPDNSEGLWWRVWWLNFSPLLESYFRGSVI